jgi:iduronate 2-sulfatase
MRWHKHTNYEIATRSPLIISAPGKSSAGQACAAPVEFVDVYPTLSELCGLPAPVKLDGSSFAHLIEDPAAASSEVAISQYPRSKDGTQLMGYTIRDARYRGTFWRERGGAKIVDAELYDEQEDPDETVSLAAKPELQAVLARLASHLPQPGADRAPAKTAKGKAKPTAGTKDAAPAEDRATRFARLYPGKDKVSAEEYAAGQTGPADVQRDRFTRLDADRDGFVSQVEFVTSGGRYKNALK